MVVTQTSFVKTKLEVLNPKQIRNQNTIKTMPVIGAFRSRDFRFIICFAFRIQDLLHSFGLLVFNQLTHSLGFRRISSNFSSGESGSGV